MKDEATAAPSMSNHFMGAIVGADVAHQLEQLQIRTQEILQRVRIGLASVKQPDSRDRLRFPGVAFELTMAMWEEPVTESGLQDFGTWVLANGFRELIERTQIHLDWAGSFCKSLKLIDELGLAEISADTEEFNLQIDSYWEKLHRMALKRKLDHLRKRYEIETDFDEAILAAQKVRNCLAHRGGRVSEEIDCSAGALRMVWVGPEIEVYSGGKEPSFLEKPEDIAPGGLFLVGTKIHRRAFEAGSQIEFGVREFNDIAITCYFYCREVTIEAIRYGRQVLKLVDQVPEISDEWRQATGVHMYLNTPGKDRKATDAVVIHWQDNRLRLAGVRRMARDGDGQEENRSENQAEVAQPDSSSEHPTAPSASGSR